MWSPRAATRGRPYKARDAEPEGAMASHFVCSHLQNLLVFRANRRPRRLLNNPLKYLWK